MVGQEHLRMPSEEKTRRGRLTIEALQKEIYLFVGVEPFKRYPNWRTDYKDYKQMLRAAREVMNRGIRAEVDGCGFGGEAGSQFVVAGHTTQRGNINLFALIDKAAANIAAREQQTKGISDEEQHQVFEEAILAGADIDEVWQEKVISRLPRTAEQVRSSILSKVFPRPD